MKSIDQRFDICRKTYLNQRLDQKLAILARRNNTSSSQILKNLLERADVDIPVFKDNVVYLNSPDK